MNREMRRLQERQERQRKKDEAKAGGRVARAQRAAQRKPSKLPWYRRLPAFLGEVRQELKRVSWPTRDQMVVFTTVTLITTTVLTLVVFGFDIGLKEAYFWLVGHT